MTDSIADQKISFLDLKMTTAATLPATPAASAPAVAVPAKKATARPKEGLLRRLGILCLIALLSLGFYWGISRFFVQSIEVVGESMVPTLDQGNHYLLNRWAYHSASPQRGDIVVIRDPADHGFSVKRVIAVEGESVHFLNGKVYVNTEQLPEPYLMAGTHTYTYSQMKEQLITCGKGQYFVLGDNRVVSIDSRSYGPVSRQDILGQVVLHK